MDGWMDEWMCIPLTVRRRRRRRRITNDVTVASVFPVSVSSVSDSVGTINQSIKSINQSSSLFPSFQILAGWLVDLMKFDFFYDECVDDWMTERTNERTNERVPRMDVCDG
jgi:hypothetical protein